MKFIFDPAIAVKIHKMKERVRWQHPSIVARGIDQTSMVLDDGKDGEPEFSFMVIGDTGTQPHKNYHPQRQVAEAMLKHQQDCNFVLHTGDVIYVVGSQEYYPQNFIQPYREFLRGGENPQAITYDNMVFNKPILPVLGNHDYYDVPWMYRLLAGTTLPLRTLLRYKDFEIGWHGSYQGNAYAKAFLDYLQRFRFPQQLEFHLDEYYTAKTDTGRCLRYEPGKFTRLPNRYYTFRYGGIDFFALDSNTFNEPSPLPDTKEGEAQRRELQQRRHEIEREELQILDACNKLNADNLESAEQLDTLRARLYQIDEVKIDIEKQLNWWHQKPDVDWEQLEWLKQRLIASWNTEEVRGRIIYFHHPPYVTEASKWYQSQTLAVRHRLRWVLDEVRQQVGNLAQNRPLVDLIFNGHAHCLEYLRTTDTRHGDSYLNCIISGGSGRHPRRQRQEGKELLEQFPGRILSKVADSLLFVGKNRDGEPTQRPYSFVRIDVKNGNPPQFIVRPFVVEYLQGQWCDRQLEEILIS